MKAHQIKYRTYLLIFSTIGMLAMLSCTKETPKPQEKTKELLATVSSNITVASGDSITFTDLSIGVENRRWTFQGGNPETSQLPVVDVVFLEEGTSVATLEVEYFDGTTESMNFDIQIFPVLIADFSLSSTRIAVGESVTFTDNSIGSPSSWYWEFEGGTPATSTEQNPTVTFNENDPVTVSLTIERELDGSVVTEEKVNVLQVGPPELCLNGNFETGEGPVVDWQTWNGAAFPYNVVAGGAEGTDFTSFIDFQGEWGWGQIISRDFPDNKIALENGNDYTIGLYIKAESPVRLDVLRGVNHLPDWSAAFDGTAEDYEEFYANSGTELPYDVTTEWTKVEIQISIPDDGKIRTNFFPDIILGEDANSRVFIDEISVKIVE